MIEQDTKPTDIILRKFKDGQIIALMPHDVDCHDGRINSYMHIGQHGLAEYSHCVNITKLATEAEYADLKKELESIGYLVNVINKQGQWEIPVGTEFMEVYVGENYNINSKKRSYSRVYYFGTDKAPKTHIELWLKMKEHYNELKNSGKLYETHKWE